MLTRGLRRRPPPPARSGMVNPDYCLSDWTGSFRQAGENSAPGTTLHYTWAGEGLTDEAKQNDLNCGKGAGDPWFDELEKVYF